MPETLHNLVFHDEDYEKAAKKWGRQLLMMPLFACSETLKYMTGIAGLRYKEALPTAEGFAQFAPYRADRKAADTTDVRYREIETFFGNVRIDFEPNKHVRMLIGQRAAFLGDGQMQAPSAKLVLAAVMKSLGHNLNDALFTARRNASGDTTKDLFNGWGTIIDDEIADGAISAAKGNLLALDEEITSANAVDLAKEIERSCHPMLRRTEKFLYCDPSFADKYNDAYLLTHAGISYNTKYEQPIVEGSGNKTTIVPLDCLAGTDKYILTTKRNMLYGYDNMSDIERLEVKRYEPWVMTLAAAMFFGCQIYTLDPRFFKVVALKNSAANQQPESQQPENQEVEPNNP